MGNCMCGARRRAGVEDRLTKPQRLARQPSNVDYKKLRKLILSRKLAPCFDAIEEPRSDLEECPICFFYYPSLNRSRCCSKGICTECFLQMKPSNSTRPAQCPFCKTSSYAVEYRGAKTKEERELEIAEEQKVIEAKLRIKSRQSAQIDLICSTSATDSIIPAARDHWSTGVDNSSRRFHDFDAGAEEVMVFEAIWRSLQDSRSRSNEVDDPDSTDAQESDGAETDTATLENLPLSGSHPTWTSDRTHRSTGSPCNVSGAVDRRVSSLPVSILTVN